MLKLPSHRVLLPVLGFCFVGALALSGWLLKQFNAYQRLHPAGAGLVKGKCKQRGLVAHWTFDEMNDEMTPDQSGVDNHGTLSFAVGPLSKYRFGFPSLVDGKVGNALELYGRQWVSGGNNDCFTTEQLTVAAWVWQEDESFEVPTIAAKSAWPYNGWWLCSTSAKVQKGDRYIDFGIAWGSDFTHVESGYQLPLREWHHIVATLDNEQHTADFFIDGKRFGSRHTNVHEWHVNFDHDLLVGDYDGSGRWPWKGKLDDVRIYNRVLTDADAAELYGQSTHASL